MEEYNDLLWLIDWELNIHLSIKVFIWSLFKSIDWGRSLMPEAFWQILQYNPGNFIPDFMIMVEEVVLANVEDYVEDTQDQC